jgi:sulfur carrier protein
VTPVQVTVNGDDMELDAGATVADVVSSLCASERGVAVAVGREVVPRSQWISTTLADGDRLEIVTAAAGG